MRDFLTALLECSVTISALALVYIVLTPLLSKRYSAKWLYYAWLVIVVGLIVPFRIHPGTVLVQVGTASVPSVPRAAGNAVIAAGAAAMPAMAASPAAQPFPWVEFLGCVWLAGVTAFVIFHIVRHLRFLRMVKRWSEPANDARLTEVLQKAKERIGVAAPVGLLICPSVSSPMTTGFRNPVILLPSSDFSSEELSCVFRHELVHWKRKDLWYKSLVLLATAIHWFNPVVYLAAKTIASQCEISCDAEVLNGAEAEERRCYGETILAVIGNRRGAKTAFSTNFNGGKRDMKKRISSILDTKAKKAGLIVLCIVLAVTASTGAVFAATGKTANVQSQSQITDEGAVRTVAVKWAEAIKKRNVDAQYDLLSQKCRADGYMADLSGPWVESYVVSVNADNVVITYHYAASEGTTGDYEQTLTLVIEDGTYKIDSYSNLEFEGQPAASAVSRKTLSDGETVRTVALKWADAVKMRDINTQYGLLSRKCRAKGYLKDVGTSGPWVESYVVSVNADNVVITYHYAASEGTTGDYEQTLTLVIEDGTYKIDSYSNLEFEGQPAASSAGTGSTIVPNDKISQYQKLQSSVDEGHRPGFMQPEEVAMEFASGTLKIGNLSKMYDKVEKAVADGRATVIFRKDGESVLKMELYQPVKKGEGGIWTVASWTDGKTGETHAVS